jgi:hypothetical protein
VARAGPDGARHHLVPGIESIERAGEVDQQAARVQPTPPWIRPLCPV